MQFAVDFGPKLSKLLRRPRNFAFEIARDRDEIHAARWCAACSRPSEVPNNCAERHHASSGEIARGSHKISDRNFRFFFAAAKFCARNHARSRRNSCRSVTRSLAATLRGPQRLCRASAREKRRDCTRFTADFGPKFSNFFTAANFCGRNRARSRRNPCRLVTRSLAATLSRVGKIDIEI